jgi:hypothetical protein
MSTRDEFDLYVSPKIRRLKNVKNMNDYLKVVSRDPREIRVVVPLRRPNLIKRLRSWSRSDKLSLTIAIIGVLALAATVLALLVTAGMLIL